MPFVANTVRARIIAFRDAIAAQDSQAPFDQSLVATEDLEALQAIRVARALQASQETNSEERARVVDWDTFEIGMLELRNGTYNNWGEVKVKAIALRDYILGRGV